MAFLEIGALTVLIDDQSARRLPSDPIGDPPERASDGTLRTTVQGFKRNWSCQTIPYVRADAEALETEIGNGPVTVEGDMVWAAAPFDAIVTVGEMTAIRDDREADEARWIVALEIREV